MPPSNSTKPSTTSPIEPSQSPQLLYSSPLASSPLTLYCLHLYLGGFSFNSVAFFSLEPHVVIWNNSVWGNSPLILATRYMLLYNLDKLPSGAVVVSYYATSRTWRAKVYRQASWKMYQIINVWKVPLYCLTIPRPTSTYRETLNFPSNTPIN